MLLNPIIKTLLKSVATAGGVGSVAIAIPFANKACQELNPYMNDAAKPVDDTPGSLDQAYLSAAVNDAAVIVGAGFTHNEPISTVNTQKQYKDTSFLGLDVAYSGSNPYNVATVNFRTDQSGFLVALAAAEYLNQNRDFFVPHTDPTTNQQYFAYACWGGVPGQSVDSYLSGFQQGMQHFNKHKSPDQLPVYFARDTQGKLYSGGFSADNADEIIQRLLFTGTGGGGKVEETNSVVTPHVIFPVAGPQTDTLVTRIFADKLKIAVVGVDTPMENDPSVQRDFSMKTSTYPTLNGKEFKSIVPFSATKNLAVATECILNNILNNIYGLNESNNYGGLNYYSVGDYFNGGAGVSDNALPYLEKWLPIIDDALNNLTTDIIGGTSYTQLRDQGWLDETESVQEQAKKQTKKISDKLKEDKLKVKLILSTSTAVLMDNSFCEEAFKGVLNFQGRKFKD